MNPPSVDNIPLIDLVLVGGGHAHALVIRQLAMQPLTGVRVSLISKDIMTPYSGMLPGFLAGDFSYQQCHIDLRKLCEYAGVRFIHARALALDLKRKQVICEDYPPILFDVVSLNIGSTPDLSQIENAAQFSLPVKPIDQFIPVIEKVFIKPGKHIAVIGGGASGVELVLAIQARLQALYPQQKNPCRFSLLCAGNTILETHNARVRKKLLQVFQQRGIKLLTRAKVQAIQAHQQGKRLIFSQPVLPDNHQPHQGGFTHLDCDTVIVATHASAAPWLKQSGLQLDKQGFVLVNDYLQSLSHPFVFAAGDIASMQNYPRPKSGVYAVRQGLPLYHNLCRFIRHKPLKTYRPQKHFLSLLNLAHHQAVASRFILAWQGQWAWSLKRWIDLRFMRMLQQLPAMDQARQFASYQQAYQGVADQTTIHKLAEIPMHCGGCAAKVSPGLLDEVLDNLRARQKGDNQDIRCGMGADDGSVFQPKAGYLLVQSVDFFRSFISDPYIFGKIALNHAMGDIYAMGAHPHSAQALIHLPFSPSRRAQQQILFPLMQGIMEQMDMHHAQLIGGHSSEATELACGFSVNGQVLPKRVLKKSALRADQSLILSKPIGSGVLLAANMRYQLDGVVLKHCLDCLLQVPYPILKLFERFQVKACTDITGFGLAGHLYEMLKSSGLSARLDLSALPLFAGVIEMQRRGIYSSLYQENLYFQQFVQPLSDTHQTPEINDRYPVLFDPQTAGALLFAVNTQEADACIETMRQAGFADACVIGQTVAEKSKHAIMI